MLNLVVVNDFKLIEFVDGFVVEFSLEFVDNFWLCLCGFNQVGMCQFNDCVVLQVLCVYGSLFKVDLVWFIGFMVQIIGLIIVWFDEDQLFMCEVLVCGWVGQFLVLIGLNFDGVFVVGIKIGWCSVDWLLVDFIGYVCECLVLDYFFFDSEILLFVIGENLNCLFDGLGVLCSCVVGVGVVVLFQLGGWYCMLGLIEVQLQVWNQIDLVVEV